MLENSYKTWFILLLMVIVASGTAWANSSTPTQGVAVDNRGDAIESYKAIAKVKPTPTQPAVTKVRPSWGWGSQWDRLSAYNPITWGPDCSLPTPAKGQFLVGPRVWFARVDGEARRGIDIAGIQSSSVDFDDHLGLRKSGNAIWSVEALYQFRPSWGIRYSFMPLLLEATANPTTAFNFMGQTFAAGTEVRSKWEHFEHRAGLVFNISRTNNSLTNLYVDWLNVQDKLRIGGTTATTSAVTWDHSKNMAVTGLEFEKCLKNFQGNTLAFSGKGGIGFLNDAIGYELEAGLNYMIPIKTGRFGFVKGGYRYAHLKKDKGARMFSTTMDGAFLQFGFLF